MHTYFLGGEKDVEGGGSYSLILAAPPPMGRHLFFFFFLKKGRDICVCTLAMLRISVNLC